MEETFFTKSWINIDRKTRVGGEKKEMEEQERDGQKKEVDKFR